MKMNRRRFLAIAACAAATPAAATTARWHGIALGADATLELNGPEHLTRPALAAALDCIRRVERLFSLYDPTSALSELNASGRLEAPAPEMLRLFDAAGQIHSVTRGLFDPTVQPLWRAHATGGDIAKARRALGWSRVQVSETAITLGRGQALTFNGIAQGFATDLVTETLRAHGLTDIHANIGEHRAQGAARRLGVADPAHGLLGHVTLENAAVATSSPGAMPLGRAQHILSPTGTKPLWSTVSVTAAAATLADGISTALCLADRQTAARLAGLPGVHRILLIDRAGDITTAL